MRCISNKKHSLMLILVYECIGSVAEASSTKNDGGNPCRMSRVARRSTEDPPERREAVQRPRAGLLLRAPHHSSRRMALRYFTLSSSLCAETIGGAWEVRLEKNMERVRAMVSISFYLYEVGSARAPKGFPWWTAGMKIDPRVPNTLIRKDYSLVNFTNIFPVSTQGLDLSNSQ